MGDMAWAVSLQVEHTSVRAEHVKWTSRLTRGRKEGWLGLEPREARNRRAALHVASMQQTERSAGY